MPVNHTTPGSRSAGQVIVPPQEPTQDDIPSQELMASLDLSVRQFPDFLKAFNMVWYQNQGMNITRAAEAAGLRRTQVYEDYWQGLIAKVQRVVVGKLMTGIIAAHAEALERWPQLLRNYITELESPSTPFRDKTTAMMFLHEAVIDKAEVPSQMDTTHQKYLSGGDFTAIQTDNVVINNYNATPLEAAGLTIDAQVTQDS